MCGIVGYWSISGKADAAVAGHMARRLRHRGPDDSGVWCDEKVGLALAHRRLSVIDPSPAGHQPMVSPCGRYVLVFNGEIYNHRDLRKLLEKEGGHFAWQGHSDTETLLAALRHWGMEETLHGLNGMFAFALWDNHERTLFLARDRMGEKPLYYGRCGDSLLFASELKALVAYPDWRGEVDRDALASYLRYGYVPTPGSIYQGIQKLPPAHYLSIREGGQSHSGPQCYWSLANLAGQASGDAAELTDALDGQLRDAVAQRMVADVPLGAFLSGGYDSSTVVALMQSQSSRPVKTFTIGFHEDAYSEARQARGVAEHLGTDHTELYVTPEQAMDVIPQLPSVWDEPFADSSQIPTCLVSKLARQSVTVSLSGDGGDELFAGYNRHVLGPAVWSRVERLPSGFRRLLGRLLAAAARRDIDQLSRFLPGILSIPQAGHKLDKVAEALQADCGEAFYKAVVSHWKDPAAVVLGGGELSTALDEPGTFPGLRERMMYLDMMTYLPDDILTKLDRASMAASLEARVPLLDHRVVEFACRVPMSLKYRNRQGKWLLRQVLYKYVPPALVDRPKQGFTVPIEQWLRGSLRDWAEDLLDENRLKQQGYFDPAPIRQCWEEHASGKRRWHEPLWDVLMFQAWLAETHG